MEMAMNQQSVETTAAVELLEEAQLRHRFYYQMYLIRRVEQQLLELYAKGLVVGPVHSSIGQEACDVGVINALNRDDDMIFSNQDARGQFITYTDDVIGLIAEIMGRRTGVCGGLGGSRHLHKFNMFSNGMQGGIVSNAVGAAMAAKLKGSGAITVVFLNQRAMSQGIVYESFNIAALWSLPVLFVLADNNVAHSAEQVVEHAGDLGSRADSFTLNARALQADNVLKVYAFSRTAIAYVRRHQSPFFLALHSNHLARPSNGDDTPGPKQVEVSGERDPLQKLGQELTDDERQLLESAVERRVNEAVEMAKNSAPLTFEEYQGRWQSA